MIRDKLLFMLPFNNSEHPFHKKKSLIFLAVMVISCGYRKITIENKFQLSHIHRLHNVLVRKNSQFHLFIIEFRSDILHMFEPHKFP